MTLTWPNVLAIAAMAVATYSVRLAGLWIAGYIPQTGRMRAAIEALPPAVLIAVVAPMALGTGLAETAAALLTVLAALRLPLLVSVAAGVLAVVLFRLALG